MKLSSYAKDNFIAPFMSAFSEANIPDLAAQDFQSSAWVSNFVLNSLFRSRYGDPHQQYAFNYLRRCEAAFEQYSLARAATAMFLDGSRQSASAYMKAVFHWEIFLSQTWQAYSLIGTAAGQKIFTRGDGSAGERLNLLYNDTKHAVEDDRLYREDTLPVWLTNDGLASRQATLSYLETASLLEELAERAELLQDAKTLSEHHRQG